MGLKLPKPIRNVVFRIRSRSRRFHSKQWGQKNYGTFYRNLAEEQFRVFRGKFEESRVSKERFITKIKVDVINGNYGLAQFTRVVVDVAKKSVELVDVNEGKTADFSPVQEKRGRNIFGALVNEAKLIGIEFFGDSSFVLKITPANAQLFELYRKAGFKKTGKGIDGMEKRIN